MKQTKIFDNLMESILFEMTQNKKSIIDEDNQKFLKKNEFKENY